MVKNEHLNGLNKPIYHDICWKHRKCNTFVIIEILFNLQLITKYADNAEKSFTTYLNPII